MTKTPYNLQTFLGTLEARKNLVRVSQAVSPELEINAILHRLARIGGPAVVFENITGVTLPLAGNLFGTMERLSLALGAAEMESLAREKAAALRKRNAEAGNAENQTRIEPAAAPCRQIQHTADQIDLNELPLLKLWPQSSGRHISPALVFTSLENAAEARFGMPDVIMTDTGQLALEWVPGTPRTPLATDIPAVLVAGAGPLLTLVSHWSHSGLEDVAAIIRILTGAPLALTPSQDARLFVPAEAEIVLEGVLQPPPEEMEPVSFCGLDGNFRQRRPAALLEPTVLSMKTGAMATAAATGLTSPEIQNFLKAEERFLLHQLREELSAVVDLNLSGEFGTATALIAAIKKQKPFQAAETVTAIRKIRPDTRAIIVVNADIDVHDPGQVLWAYSIHCRPEHDVVMAEADPDSSGHNLLTIDATPKGPEEGYRRQMPDKVVMDEKITARVDSMWTTYGFSH